MRTSAARLSAGLKMGGQIHLNLQYDRNPAESSSRSSWTDFHRGAWKLDALVFGAVAPGTAREETGSRSATLRQLF